MRLTKAGGPLIPTGKVGRNRLARRLRPGEPCVAGHPYKPMRDTRGWLRCMTCHNARSRRAQDRARAEKVIRYGTHDLRNLKFQSVAPVACEQCGKPFTRKRYEWPSEFKSRRYCTYFCVSIARQGGGSPMYRGGAVVGRGKGWVRLAEAVRCRDGHTCQRCGRTQEENGGRKLAVDHIIPWRLFTNEAEANADNNLVSLCFACHGWKTAYAEHRYLKGDVLDFEAYVKAIKMKSASKFQARGQGE